MKKLHFSIHILASCEQVWRTVIDDRSYRLWTRPFCEGSYFEGCWAVGERIRFLSPSGGGMTAVIAEYRPHVFLSIKHLGYIRNGVEDTESEEVRSWAPAFENYTFVNVEGGTELRIEQDIADEYEKYMLETWPKALAALKALSETPVL